MRLFYDMSVIYDLQIRGRALPGVALQSLRFEQVEGNGGKKVEGAAAFRPVRPLLWMR